MRGLLAAATALCISATSAHAQWSQIGGEYGMNMDFRTSASLSCMKEIYNTQTCTSDGTKVRQWNGDAFADVSFTGVMSSLTVSSQRGGPVGVGKLSVRYGGTGAFEWPPMVAPGIGSFAMYLKVQTLNAPTTPSGTIGFQFMQIGPSLMRAYLGEAQGNYVIFDIPHPQPSGLTYQDVVFENFNLPHIDKLVDADYDIYAASVTVTPEPTTYALMAIGLAAIAVAGRKRRKR